MRSVYGYAFGFIGFVSGVAGTAALIPTNPLLGGVSISLILASLFFVFFIKYFYSHFLISRGIKKVSNLLKKENYQPDLLVSFSRSGAVAAGMISVNLGLQELIVFSRKLIDKGDSNGIWAEKFSFSSYLGVNKEELNAKRILIVFMVLDTAETLRVGLEYLKDQGIDAEVFKIATICISPGARRRWPQVIYAYETSNIKEFLENLPWSGGDYHHV